MSKRKYYIQYSYEYYSEDVEKKITTHSSKFFTGNSELAQEDIERFKQECWVGVYPSAPFNFQFTLIVPLEEIKTNEQ